MLMSFVVPRENKTDAVVEIIITAAIAQLLKQQNIIQSLQRQPTSQLEVCAAFSRAHACIALSSCSTRLHGIYFYCCCIRNIIITGAGPFSLPYENKSL